MTENGKPKFYDIGEKLFEYPTYRLGVKYIRIKRV
jgi:hypothetical protein